LATSPIYVAYKTLEAIRVAIEKDQGAKYRGILRNLMPLAEDAYSEKNDRLSVVNVNGLSGTAIDGHSKASSPLESCAYLIEGI
jgi:hypothetical protein